MNLKRFQALQTHNSENSSKYSGRFPLAALSSLFLRTFSFLFVFARPFYSTFKRADIFFSLLLLSVEISVAMRRIYFCKEILPLVGGETCVFLTVVIRNSHFGEQSKRKSGLKASCAFKYIKLSTV